MLCLEFSLNKYRRASKKQKGLILTEVVSLTNYHRKHARRLLINPPSKKKFRRNKSSGYQPILPQLKKLWAVSNFACGKILIPALPNLLKQLLKFNEINEYFNSCVGGACELIILPYSSLSVIIRSFRG